MNMKNKNCNYAIGGGTSSIKKMNTSQWDQYNTQQGYQAFPNSKSAYKQYYDPKQYNYTPGLNGANGTWKALTPDANVDFGAPLANHIFSYNSPTSQSQMEQTQQPRFVPSGGNYIDTTTGQPHQYIVGQGYVPMHEEGGSTMYDKGGDWIGHANEEMDKNHTKGTFTKYCGGKVTESCIEKGLKSKDATTRKRAAFAKAMRSIHKKDLGGSDIPGGETDGVVEAKKKSFVDYLMTNTMKALGEEASMDINKFHDQAMMAFGGPTMDSFGYNPNQNNQSMYSSQVSLNKNQQMFDRNNFFGATTDLLGSINNPNFDEGGPIKDNVSTQQPNIKYQNSDEILKNKQALELYERAVKSYNKSYLPSAYSKEDALRYVNGIKDSKNEGLGLYFADGGPTGPPTYGDNSSGFPFDYTTLPDTQLTTIPNMQYHYHQAEQFMQNQPLPSFVQQQVQAGSNPTMDPNQTKNMPITSQMNPDTLVNRHAPKTTMHLNNGEPLANWAIAGMNGISSMIEKRDRKAVLDKYHQRQNADAVFTPVTQGSTNRGDYDINSGAFRPDDMIPIQFQGYNAGNLGSPQRFKKGGEYYLDDHELEKMKLSGYMFEFL